MNFQNTVHMINILTLQKYIQKYILKGYSCSIIAIELNIDNLDMQYKILYSIERLREGRIFLLPLQENQFILIVDTSLEQTILFTETIQKYLNSKFDYNLSTIAITSFEQNANYSDRSTDMIERVRKFLAMSKVSGNIVYGTKTYNSMENISFPALFKYLIMNNYQMSIVFFNKMENDYTESKISIKYINDNIVVNTNIDDFIYLHNSGAKNIILNNNYIIGKISLKIEKYDFDKSEIICSQVELDSSYLFRRLSKRVTPKQTIELVLTNGENKILTGTIIDFSKNSISVSLPKEIVNSDLMEALRAPNLYVYFSIYNTNLTIVSDFYTIEESNNDDNSMILVLFLFPDKDIEEFFDKFFDNQEIKNIENVKKMIENTINEAIS